MGEDRPLYGERAQYGPGDVCYRHPDRNTFTLCQRCGNNICAECQNVSPVGMLCDTCVGEQQQRVASSQGPSSTRIKRAVADSSVPVITYAIMGLSVIVFLAQNIFPGVTSALWYAPVYSIPEQFEPWRMITAMFTHSTGSFFHILFNLYALWLFGRELERFAGRAYFTVVYFFSGFGGSLAVMLWGYTSIDALRTPTVGASGAIFGVLGAMLIVMKATQVNVRSLVILIGINVVIGFLPGTNISWQAHLGGLLVGMATMFLLLKFRGPRNKVRRLLTLTGLGGVLVLLAFAFYFIDPVRLLI